MMLPLVTAQTSRGAKLVLAKLFHTLYIRAEGPVSAHDLGGKWRAAA